MTASLKWFFFFCFLIQGKDAVTGVPIKLGLKANLHEIIFSEVWHLVSRMLYSCSAM